MFSSSRSLNDVREGSVPPNFASSRNRRQSRGSSGCYRPGCSNGILHPKLTSPRAKKLRGTPPSILKSSKVALSSSRVRSNRFKLSRSASPLARPFQNVNPLDLSSSASQSPSRTASSSRSAYLNAFGNPPPDCSVTDCSRTRITFSSPSSSNGYVPSCESSNSSFGSSRAQQSSPPPHLNEDPIVTTPSCPDLLQAVRVHQECDKSSAKAVEYAFNSSRYGETYANYNARLVWRRPNYGFGASTTRPLFDASNHSRHRNHPFRKSGSVGDVSEGLDNFDCSNYGQFNNKKRPMTLARMTKSITNGMSAFYFENGEN